MLGLRHCVPVDAESRGSPAVGQVGTDIGDRSGEPTSQVDASPGVGWLGTPETTVLEARGPITVHGLAYASPGMSKGNLMMARQPATTACRTGEEQFQTFPQSPCQVRMCQIIQVLF